MRKLWRRKRRIHYFYDYNPYQKVKAVHAVFKAAAAVVAVAGLVVLGIWLDSKRLARHAGPSEATKPTTLSYAVDRDTFTTKYFQMEAPTTWEFEEKASGPNKFVYYNFRNKLVRGTITVYVNQAPAADQLHATRVLPVRLGSDGSLKPDSAVSDHCNKVAPGKDKVGEETIKFKNVASFPCDNDATWYSALAGMDGGSPAMNLKRPDGSTAQYYIYYTNPTANPDGNDFVEVMSKFKVL